MKNKIIMAVLVIGLGAGASFQASAQAKPEVLVKQRQAAMALQGKYFGPIGAMVNGKIAYDEAVIVRNAAYLEVLTKMAWDGFKESTAGIKSAAKPEIYKDPAKFQTASENLESAAVKLAAAARSGSRDAVKAAFGATGKTCKGCHDDFKVKK